MGDRKVQEHMARPVGRVKKIWDYWDKSRRRKTGLRSSSWLGLGEKKAAKVKNDRDFKQRTTSIGGGHKGKGRDVVKQGGGDGNPRPGRDGLI